MDEIKKPECVGKFQDDFKEDDVVIARITMRNVNFQGKDVTAIGVGCVNSKMEDFLREEHEFRAAVKDAFLQWLNSVAKVT